MHGGNHSNILTYWCHLLQALVHGYGLGSLKCASIWIMIFRVGLNKGHFSVSVHLTCPFRSGDRSQLLTECLLRKIWKCLRRCCPRQTEIKAMWYLMVVLKYTVRHYKNRRRNVSGSISRKGQWNGDFEQTQLLLQSPAGSHRQQCMLLDFVLWHYICSIMLLLFESSLIIPTTPFSVSNLCNYYYHKIALAFVNLVFHYDDSEKS